jgi:CheY-like chemotaxis protein
LIRKGPSNSSDVPIIAATAHALPDDLTVFREAGMNDVLVKPISAKSIRLALANALLDDDVDNDERVILSDITSSALIIDWDRLEELEHDLNTDQLRTALIQFRSDLDQFMTDASHWLQKSIDRKTLSEEAHRMAGSAGVFGAMRLTNQMRNLQTEAKTATPSALNDLVAEVKISWKLTRTELDKVDA